MSTLNHAVAPRPAVYGSPISMASSSAPSGTFLPGTKVQVGSHRVIIEKYLSEGGFAHVYVVRVPRASDDTEKAVLKRVAVPDKEALASMRTEVETMKRLKGNRHIVTYIDSHASQLKGGGYEVFLLMEYCAGGGLIDFMNTRLQQRLTESEIVEIITDVAEGVARMHYLKPPLLHRDLKVENVLIAKHGSSTIYKLCDFGSAAPRRPAATTAAEGRLLEDDVQRHTTLQYRSPEMIDVYRKQPIDEKSDIWALGVLLYKLCYYTTPFEERGQMAILTASFKYPAYPPFSNKLKLLIASMLREDPNERPNIYQVLKECCAMRGIDITIKDAYSNRSQSEARTNEEMPAGKHISSSTTPVGARRSPPTRTKMRIPDVIPMRRGRPDAPSSHWKDAKSNLSPEKPLNGDRFVALDSKSLSERNAAVDELASKFPSLDEFSLLHDRDSKVDFRQRSANHGPINDVMRKRLTDALADDAFAQPIEQKSEPTSRCRTPTSLGRTASLRKETPVRVRPEIMPQAKMIHQPTPQRPGMVSRGTMTTPSPSPQNDELPYISPRSVWRVPTPTHRRSLSALRASGDAEQGQRSLAPMAPSGPKPELSKTHRSKSQTAESRYYEAKRSSLENGRPSALGVDQSTPRSKSANMHSTRSSSGFIDSGPDNLSDGESSRKPSRSPLGRFNHANERQQQKAEQPAIVSDIAFLRTMEDEDATQRHSQNLHGHRLLHIKRASMPTMGLSGPRNIVTGKFGEAFKRFEHSNSVPTVKDASHPGEEGDGHLKGVKSIATSNPADLEAAVVLEEIEELSPELRREMERRSLAEEEKRVEAAAAEHKIRLAARAKDGAAARGIHEKRVVSSASTIQTQVQHMLDMSGQGRSVHKSAASDTNFTSTKDGPLPAKKKIDLQSDEAAKPQKQPQDTYLAQPLRHEDYNSEKSPRLSHPPSRPSAPPKPRSLRTGVNIDTSRPSAQLQALMNADARPEEGSSGRGTHVLGDTLHVYDLVLKL